MGEDGEERPADFDQIVENTGLDPEQVGLTSRLQTMIFSLESDNCTENKVLVILSVHGATPNRTFPCMEHGNDLHIEWTTLPPAPPPDVCL